eukprot:1159232-Pelagomonas_calceolata.AAC.12
MWYSPEPGGSSKSVGWMADQVCMAGQLGLTLTALLCAMQHGGLAGEAHTAPEREPSGRCKLPHCMPETGCQTTACQKQP